MAALKRGHPVLLGNDLTPAGHILVATGYAANNQLIVNDPYGNRFSPGYGGTEGEGLFYPFNCSRVRVALEIIGAYPPPTLTPTVSPTSTSTPPASATPPITINKVAPLVAYPTPLERTPTPSKKKNGSQAQNSLRNGLTPFVPAPLIGGTGHKTTITGEQGIRWAMLSVLFVAAAFAGLFTRQRLKLRSASLVVVPVVVPVEESAPEEGVAEEGTGS